MAVAEEEAVAVELATMSTVEHSIVSLTIPLVMHLMQHLTFTVGH